MACSRSVAVPECSAVTNRREPAVDPARLAARRCEICFRSRKRLARTGSEGGQRSRLCKHADRPENPVQPSRAEPHPRTKPCVLAQALAGRNTFQKRTLKRRYNPCRWEKPIRSRTTGHQGPERAVASRDGLAAGGHRAREGPALFLPFGSGMLVIESGRLPPSAHHAHRPQSARGFRP